jgi:hypothetical protein
MRTTVDIPAELLRAAKAQAAREGQAFNDIVVQGLQAILGQTPPPSHTKFPTIKAKSPGKRVLPEDIVSEIMLIDDLERHEALIGNQKCFSNPKRKS